MIDTSTNGGGANLIGKQISILFRQLNLYLSSLYEKDGITQDDH